MSPQLLGIVLGGLIPAVCFGLTGVLAKISMNRGMDIASYLLCVGAAVILDGIILLFVVTQRSYDVRSAFSAAGVGFVWGVGIALFAFVLSSQKAPVSAIVSFHSAAPLVSVLLAFLLFAEWKEVNVPLLLIGSVLMVCGGILVGKAS